MCAPRAARAAHGESSWAVSCLLVRLVLSPPPLQTSASADFKQNTGQKQKLGEENISYKFLEQPSRRPSIYVLEESRQSTISHVLPMWPKVLEEIVWKVKVKHHSPPLLLQPGDQRSRSEKLWKEPIVLRPISKYFSSLENLLLVMSKLDEGVTCKNMTASKV